MQHRGRSIQRRSERAPDAGLAKVIVPRVVCGPGRVDQAVPDMAHAEFLEASLHQRKVVVVQSVVVVQMYVDADRIDKGVGRRGRLPPSGRRQGQEQKGYCYDTIHRPSTIQRRSAISGLH